MYNAVIMEAAEAHLGVEEWPGAKNNPVIMAYFEASGHSWVDGDETAWCAAFVNAVLGEVGLTGTGALNARSFLEFGQPVGLAEVRAGDVVVFWRESPQSWKGHVGFVSSVNGGKVQCLGGNQGNKVSVAEYPMSRVLGFRRADGGKDTSNRPVLRMGSKGQFVRDLQRRLHDLRYFAGAIDGDFGGLTDAAVRRFQKAQLLDDVDGIVGRKTWAALDAAKPAQQRHATEKDLLAYGSETISTADVAEKGVRRSLLGAGGLSAVDLGVTAMNKLTAASGALSGFQDVLTENWLAIVVLLGAVIGWFVIPPLLQRIKKRRVDDHNTGVHIGTRGNK